MLLTPTKGPESPQIILRMDNAAGFVAARTDERLVRAGISINLGEAKFTNRNPCGEKAIQEVQRELRTLAPHTKQLTSTDLALAISHVNACIRSTGLSSSEMWLGRSQTTLERLEVKDTEVISLKHKQRVANHLPSAKSKASLPRQSPVLFLGDLVCIRKEDEKLHPRPEYMVASVDHDHCYIHKLVNGIIRSKKI